MARRRPTGQRRGGELPLTRRGDVQSGQSEPDDPHRRHRSVDHDPGADLGRDPEHESDLDRSNRRHRKSVLPGNHRAARRRPGACPIRSAFLRHHQSQRLSLDLRPGGSGYDHRRVFGRLRLVRPEFHCRPRRLVRRGGVGLFHQRRTDVDEIRNRHSRGRLVVHWRNDRRQHAAKLHLGAGGRQPALLYAQRRHDLEPHHASRRDQLEQF